MIFEAQVSNNYHWAKLAIEAADETTARGLAMDEMERTAEQEREMASAVDALGDPIAYSYGLDEIKPLAGQSATIRWNGVVDERGRVATLASGGNG